MKKKKGRIKAWSKGIILIIILFLFAGIGLYFYGTTLKEKGDIVNTTEVKETIEKYNYNLNDNVTNYYKQEFDKLKTLEDEKEIASQVAKLYVIDLFSIDYKINKYEVTSSQYFYSDKRDMHTRKVIDNLYNTVEDNSYADRHQDLPEVVDVEVLSNNDDEYKLNDTAVKSYVVELKITYKKDLGYDTKSKVTLVKDTNNISVVNYKAL